MTDKTRLNITFPDTVKKELEKMAVETGISMNQLVVLATNSLLANYNNKGSFIFVDLLNPEHKNKP